MGNTIAMIVGVGQGKEVLLEEKCHIINFEAGNISRLAHAVPRSLPSNRGTIPLDLLETNIHTALREHITETKAIALENTHNVWGGALLGPDYIKDVANLAKKYNLYLHLDGARVFNASIAIKIDVKEIAKHCKREGKFLLRCFSRHGASKMTLGFLTSVGLIYLFSREDIKDLFGKDFKILLTNRSKPWSHPGRWFDEYLMERV